MSITSSKNAIISHFLGIDYGKSKVGLAMGDSETRMAFGYATLNNDKNLLQKLAEIIKKEDISKVIIGICVEVKPLRLKADGSQSLGNSVSKLAGIEVEYQDEMFTTQQAQRNLIEKGVKGIKRFDDQEAARLILQGWLDKQK